MCVCICKKQEIYISRKSPVLGAQNGLCTTWRIKKYNMNIWVQHKYDKLICWWYVSDIWESAWFVFCSHCNNHYICTLQPSNSIYVLYMTKCDYFPIISVPQQTII